MRSPLQLRASADSSAAAEEEARKRPSSAAAAAPSPRRHGEKGQACAFTRVQPCVLATAPAFLRPAQRGEGTGMRHLLLAPLHSNAFLEFAPLPLRLRSALQPGKPGSTKARCSRASLPLQKLARRPGSLSPSSRRRPVSSALAWMLRSLVDVVNHGFRAPRQVSSPSCRRRPASSALAWMLRSLLGVSNQGFRSPPRRAGYFPLSRQRKVTKGKTTPQSRRSDCVRPVPCGARQPPAGEQLGHPWPQTVRLSPVSDCAPRRD